MSISIPAIVDTQLTALRTSMQPKQDGVTHTESFVVTPAVLGNRAGDLLEILTNLIDATGLAVQGIHAATDAADVVATANATDPTTGYALANALKAAYNLHIAKTPAVHWAADATNVVTAPDADSEAKLYALANDIKAQLNAHIVKLSANTHRFSDSKETISIANATNYATSYTLLNAIKVNHNLHVVDIGCSSTALARTSAFTGVNSMIGAKVTFDLATTTVALRGKVAYVASSTVTLLNFLAALPATPVTGDLFAIEFAAVDKDLLALRGGKGMGDSASNPYGSGPSLINALVVLITQVGGSVPSYLVRVTDGGTKETLYDPAEPFSIGSPHGANPSTRGTAALMLMADALLQARNAVAAYTKPA